MGAPPCTVYSKCSSFMNEKGHQHWLRPDVGCPPFIFRPTNICHVCVWHSNWPNRGLHILPGMWSWGSMWCCFNIPIAKSMLKNRESGVSHIWPETTWWFLLFRSGNYLTFARNMGTKDCLIHRSTHIYRGSHPETDLVIRYMKALLGVYVSHRWRRPAVGFARWHRAQQVQSGGRRCSDHHA